MSGEEWQRKIHKTLDIMDDEGTFGVRYVVGVQADTLAESVLSVNLNEAAALLAVGDKWGSGLIVQVIDVYDWTLYTFDTGHERRPMRLTDADTIERRAT